MNDQQELLLDGVASRSREDSLSLWLQNFDLGPFTQIAERMGYYIEGRTNGSAAMKSVLQAAEITADILLDSVEVNDIPAPPMRLSSRWDFAQNRAGVTVTNRVKRDTLIRGFYAPVRNRYYARMRVDSLDMALLDPILAGVVSSTEGLASADLVLQGAGAYGRSRGSACGTSARRSTTPGWPTRCPKRCSRSGTTASRRRTSRCSTRRATAGGSIST